MSSKTKMFAGVGALLLVGALAFKVFVADKPPAPTVAERGFHP